MISVKISIPTRKSDPSQCVEGQLFEEIEGRKYFEVRLIPQQGNQYGNHWMAVQGVSAELRRQGVKGNIIGNAKAIGEKPVDQMLSFWVDWPAVDRDRLYPGEKARYLDLVLIPAPRGEDFAYIVRQEASKKERIMGISQPKLGVARWIERREGADAEAGAAPREREREGASSAPSARPAQAQGPAGAAPPAGADDDDIPF